ncbi:hypothetical protein RINTU1_09790 [Candidatus Regiella insecticola]|uniref:Uncharacterized protein n=1 Tax=Candidatus Regiella insecticola TaxID=138073 RepID=A0A6L2ZLH8_9ENTR|nr:hypothetical protein RINTU1_09790 [Candidatus Regiella insecticola]
MRIIFTTTDGFCRYDFSGVYACRLGMGAIRWVCYPRTAALVSDTLRLFSSCNATEYARL